MTSPLSRALVPLGLLAGLLIGSGHTGGGLLIVMAAGFAVCIERMA